MPSSVCDLHQEGDRKRWDQGRLHGGINCIWPMIVLEMLESIGHNDIIDQSWEKGTQSLSHLCFPEFFKTFYDYIFNEGLVLISFLQSISS